MKASSPKLRTYGRSFPQLIQLDRLKMSKSSKSKKANDPVYDHSTQVQQDGKSKRLQLKCNYCAHVCWGGTIRMKNHLAGTRKDVTACKKCSEEVRNSFKKILEDLSKKKSIDDYFGGGGGDEDEGDAGELGVREGATPSNPTHRLTLNTMLKKKQRDEVCQSISRCLYANALPFALVKDQFFKQMVKDIGEYGPGLKPPSYHEARVSMLKKEVNIIKGEMIDRYKAEWKKTGCTIMSDGWTDGCHRSITNFLVNSPRGTVFLRSIDISSIHKDVDQLFMLLDSLVEEVGEQNVVQVVTDSASAYVKAGEMLMEKRKHLFWSPCAAHCLDNILKDIGGLQIHQDTVSKARAVTVYIYTHTWVLNLMRKFIGGNLTRAGVTRFATEYLTLKTLAENKIGLNAMFSSEEWQRSPFAKKRDGLKVREIIVADATFWPAVKYCLNCVVPLVKVLRLVDGDAKPAMGYIYEAMDKAKEQIAKSLGTQKRYLPIWKIIDERWNLQLHRPLHAAAYFLNPRYQYDPGFAADYEIKKGLYDTIERMCPSSTLREQVDKQLDIFSKAEMMFGINMAIQMREKKQPALWWESFGGGCKELSTLAIRILSLTCSATGCERNWSTFDQIHSKRRNRLEQQRLDALVFVKYNLRLEQRHKKRVAKGESFDPISLSDMESDDEWITEKEDPVLSLDLAWMKTNSVDCFQVEEIGEGSKRKRKRGPRNLTYEKNIKGKQVLVNEEVRDEDEVQEVQEVEDEDVGSEDMLADEDMNAIDLDSDNSLDN